MRTWGLVASVILVACYDGAPSGDATDASSDSSSAGPSTTASSQSGGTSQGPSTTSSDATTDTPPTSTSAPTTDPETTESSSGSTTGEPDFPDVDVSDPQLYEFELDPLVLDPTCVDNLELQYAHLDTRAEPIGKLVFFLSGYTNTPASWRDHGRQLAGHGFHVVEPHYDNSWTCMEGGDCNANTRWEALTGEDTSTTIDTSRADSAEGRVVTMLRYLEKEHPGGDWGWYLNDDDTLRYEHVIIAGISHGASSSGLFASRRSFFRAVMHSGGWGSVGDDPETPIEEFYGLAHTGDEQYDGIISSWESAGLLGAPTSIDGATPPYDDSHQLISSADSTYPHCSVCVHSSSPMDGDAFVFDPAWRYMYGAPSL
jgi:hypothetical protein